MNTESTQSKKLTGPAIGIAIVFGIYFYLIQTLSVVKIARFEFTFFPIPKFTLAGELAFLLLVISVGVWHIRLAFEEEGLQRHLKIMFGLLLLGLPMLFRVIALSLMGTM